MDLQAEIEAIAASAADYLLGAAVTEVRTGRQVAAVNPDRPFQLASIFKVPVLITAFRCIHAGELALDSRHELRAEHKLIGSGILSELDAGLQPTLRDLLTLMIIISDNTATDKVLSLIGGVTAVDQTLRDLGIDGIRIRHTCCDLLHAVFPADELLLTEAEIARYAREHHLQRQDNLVAPDAATNTGTPAALNVLLCKLERSECASAESTAAMLSILKHQTFNQRLPRSWPEEVVFAHKTGTLSAMRGDCGLLYLPDRVIAVSALVQAVNVPLPLSPAQQAAGDALLSRVGDIVYRWAIGE